MKPSWVEPILHWNGVTVFLIVIVLLSLIQGWRRGASRSVGALFSLIVDGILTVAGILCSLGLAMWLSPKVQQWLAAYMEHLPQRELSGIEQFYYTLVAGLEGFPLLRFAVLFMLSYAIAQFVLRAIYVLMVGGKSDSSFHEHEKKSGFFSRMAGAGIGTLIGGARAIMVIALLFIGVSLYPDSGFSSYVQASPIYKQGAQSVIEPLSGTLIKDKLPVFTQAVTKELNGILQRKYEMIDREIPNDIGQAAAKITQGMSGDEQKARALYEWVGTRISYDFGKVEAYEQRGDWHEQTPRDTFDTRKGVCIDYARLYAMMARSQGLQVKVVTGLGYNGQGGYGSHAWNEVYLSAQDQWVPLDPTWAQSGDWFNPPGFAQTHIKDKVI
jgi:hypothetical protein